MKTMKKLRSMRNCGVRPEIYLGHIQNSDDCDEKYMKIKFDSDNELPLNKTIEIPSMTIVVKAIFFENNKYYPHVF